MRMAKPAEKVGSTENREGGVHLKCMSHPKYQGIRKPRVECRTCWEIYYEKQKEAKND